MKKIIAVLLALVLLCGAVLLSSCTANRDPYHYYDLPPNFAPAARLPDDAIIHNDETGIPDATLYLAVLRAIDRGRAWQFETTGEGVFTAGEAAAITSITIIPAAVHVRGFENDDSESPDLSLQPRRNLRGIEHLRNLEELRMDEKCGVNWTSLSGGLDCFSELRRLEHLPHLRMLCFLSVYTMNGEGEREFLRDLRPLRNLTQLTSLRISGLTSLDGIQNLTDLEYLSVWGMLSDLRGIERLTNLRNLHVSGGELTNLDEVRNLVNLTSLWAPNNQLTDISAVVRLPNLQDLGVARNQLETLPDLTVTNLQPSNTCFRGNRLSREEFERNLPASLLEANDGRWLESHLDQQR